MRGKGIKSSREIFGWTFLPAGHRDSLIRVVLSPIRVVMCSFAPLWSTPVDAGQHHTSSQVFTQVHTFRDSHAPTALWASRTSKEGQRAAPLRRPSVRSWKRSVFASRFPSPALLSKRAWGKLLWMASRPCGISLGVSSVEVMTSARISDR